MCPEQIRRIVDQNLHSMLSVEGNLFSATGGVPPKTILVSSARAGEGKSTCAVALASSLSRGGIKKVLLVEGNIRNPALHKVFGIQPGPGLIEWLGSEKNEAPVLHKVDQPPLQVMVYGSDHGDAAKSFNINGFEAKFEALKNSFDYVIFDGPPVMTSSEACLMARFFDGVLLVVECEKTKWEVVELAKNMVTQSGGKPLGVILNKRRYYVPRFLYGSI